MFVRVTRVKRGDKVYEYPQLVESYRNEKGTPTHRVVASLKDWSPEAIENLRKVLKAKKDPTALIEAATGQTTRRSKTRKAPAHQVLRNLEYLSVAVLDDGWTSLGLDGLLDDVLPSASHHPHGDVLRVLALHRCVAPGSKWSACQWYPTTALPALFGIPPRRFNNSRVHRALNALGDEESQLQARLGRRVRQEGEGVVSAFVDLTDTWFVGRGPPLASSGRTKEGLVRQKIGIALLCDQRGYPLRWQTVDGRSAEPPVMLDLLRGAVADGVIDDEPVVMDRAMGRGAHMAALSDAGIRHVTAVVRPEFRSFAPDGPWEALADVAVAGSERTVERDMERLASAAREAGMEAASDGRFVLDLGVARCPLAEARSPSVHRRIFPDLLAEIDVMTQVLDAGTVPTREALAEGYGVSRDTISRYFQLRRLCEPVRARVMAGEAESLYLEELRAIARQPADAQETAFDALLQTAGRQERDRAKPPKILDVRDRTLLLRRVAWFSPALLLRRRTTALKRLGALKRSIEELNAAQRERRRPRPAVALLADARVLLERAHWLSVFEVTTRKRRMNGRDHDEIVLHRREEAWRRRRSLDGFGLIAASPYICAPAGELVRLYFSKDVVEKDFQVIKSELDIRPVHHRTDLKVRSHVSICMLALLLRRHLEVRLREAGLAMTADVADAELRTCHLNELRAPGEDPYRVVTRPTTTQRSILKALELERLLRPPDRMDPPAVPPG